MILLVVNARFYVAFAFEGTITATLTQGRLPIPLLYTVSTNAIRTEITDSTRPNPINFVDRSTGGLTLVFPHNRSYMRLSPSLQDQSAPRPGFPAMTEIPAPAGIGPQAPFPAAPSAGVGPTNLPGMPALPRMPQRAQMPSGMGAGNPSGMPAMPMPAMIPQMMMDKLELKATTDTTNLLGYPCTRYMLKQRGEVMEIWATDKLLPFPPYVQHQPRHFGPRMMEEEWGGLLKAKKLFPLLAVLRFEMSSVPGQASPAPTGPERMRFEVQRVTPKRITDDALFRPPPDYHEIQPLPF